MQYYICIPTYLILTLLIGLVGLAHTLAPPSPMVVYPHPQTAQDFVQRGDRYAQRHEYAPALADYRQAEQLDPTNSVIYLKQGAMLSALNRPQDAIARYEIFKTQSILDADLVQYQIDQERQRLP